MRRIADIDILDDQSLLRDMTVQGWIILAAGVALGLAGIALGLLSPRGVGVAWFLCVAAAYVASLAVHELVHACLFKLFGGRGAHVGFGARWGMLYTSAKGLVLPRKQFCCVLLGPSVIVTAALLVAGALIGQPLAGWAVAFLHLSGCTGDFAMVRAIAGEPRALLVEDTEKGVALYEDS